MMMTKIEEDPEWATADVSEEDDFERYKKLISLGV